MVRSGWSFQPFSKPKVSLQTSQKSFWLSVFLALCAFFERRGSPPPLLPLRRFSRDSRRWRTSLCALCLCRMPCFRNVVNLPSSTQVGLEFYICSNRGKKIWLTEKAWPLKRALVGPRFSLHYLHYFAVHFPSGWHKVNDLASVLSL